MLYQIDADEVVGFGEIRFLPQCTVEIEPREGTQTNPIKHHGTLIEQLCPLLGGQFHFTEHLPESGERQLTLVGDLQGGRQHQ